MQPTGQHTLIATDFARNWWNTAAVVSLTVWNVTLPVDGDSTFSPSMTRPSRSWTGLPKVHSVRVMQ